MNRKQRISQILGFLSGQRTWISIMRIDIWETNGNRDTIPVFESVTWCFNGIYELMALPFNRETQKYIRPDMDRNMGT